MVTDTTKFARGLADSAAMVKGFQRSATTDFAAGNKLMRAGLANISDGLQGVGIIGSNAMKSMAAAVGRAAPKILSSLGPVRDAAVASAGALAFTYGGAARGIGAGLSKAAAPLVAVAAASASSLSYAYGPAIVAIGSRLSAAFAIATRTMMPMAASLGTVAVGLGRVAVAALLAARGILKLGAAGAIRGFMGLTAAIGYMVGAGRAALAVLGKFALIAGVIAAIALVKLVKGAMAIGEQADRARIVFKGFAKDVIAQADLMAGAFGVSKTAYIQAASAFGSIFKGVGYDEQAAARLSNHFVKLATDLSSFAHIPVADALEKIQSGLAGQVRPLREVGVFMSEESIQAEAARLGIARLGTELTESQKVQARISFITRSLADANGNLALTAGSAANQWRALQGRFESFNATVGTALLPTVTAALGEINTAITALRMAWEESFGAATSTTLGVVGMAHQQAESIGWIQKSIGFVADAWQTLRLGFMAVQSYITEGISKLIGGVGWLQDAILAFVNKLTGKNLKGSDFFKVWSEDLNQLSGKQWEEFQKQLAKPPASESIDAYFAKARAKTEELRKEIAKPAPSIAGLKPKAEEPLKGKEVKFASAMTRGSSEAASTILRSRFGGGKTADELKKTANNTAKANEHLSKIAGALTGGGIGTLSVMETL